jgi:predicted TIM-barrel fold metal-dependent hydrolase
MSAQENTKSKGYDLDWIVSVDDHVIEPPNVWVDRLPSKYQDTGPRVITESDGNEFWVYEDKKMITGGLGATAGRPPEDITIEGYPYSQMRPGCYDPLERIKDMNEAGVLASLNFPSIPRFCGQLFWEAKDKDLALLCVKAYNDWMIDEWCAAAPGRFIPLTIIPLWDPKEAVKEIERTAEKGSTSFCFSENLEPLGLPTIEDPSGYWNPVFQAANDTGQILSIHIGSSSTMYKVSSTSPFLGNMSLGMIRPAGCMVSWIFSGLLQKFPNIKIALSEGSIGWIPWILERANQVYHTQRHWVARGLQYQGNGAEGAHGTGMIEGADVFAMDVYRDYREHFYGCFIDDHTGLGMLDVIGEDNVMIEMDYPHSDTTWPHSLKLAHERLNEAGLSDEVQYKILRGNAEKLYRFESATPPADLIRP